MGCRISLLPWHDMIQKLATATGPQLQFPVRVLLSGILQCNRHCICTSRYCKAIKAFALGIHGHYRGCRPVEKSALPQPGLKVAKSTGEDQWLHNQMKAGETGSPTLCPVASYHSTGTPNSAREGSKAEVNTNPSGSTEKRIG